MESRSKLTMCRLCLCEQECFINIFELDDWQGFIAAEVITDLLQFQVSKTDGYPDVVCSKCIEKLTDFKLFKECCQKTKVKYDSMFVSRKNLEENKPEVDIGDGGTGFELREQDHLREALSDVTIKSEEVIIDSSSYEFSEDPLIETEMSCGPILLKYEVLPFSRDSRPKEELIDSDVSGNQEIVESTDAFMQDSSQDDMEPLILEPEEGDIDSTEVEVPLVETIIYPEYPRCLENRRQHLTSNGEIEADSCTWKISTNNELIFEKTKNISLSEEIEASSSGTMERMELQRILPEDSMDMDPLIQQEKERMRMEQDIDGDRGACRGTGRVKGVRERREGLECFHCGIVLKSKLGLIQHMKVHGFANSHDCAECGKVFHFNCYLKRNLLTHTGSKPYKCAECSKSFIDNSKLKNHMRIHTGSKPYKCEECSKSFRQNSHLKSHTRIHTGSKPYKCPECSKSFNQCSNLKNHMRLHTGSKPYKCAECSKSFSKSSYLKIHMRYHTGFKPYKCAECSKHFHQNCDLTRHMRSHTGSKPYKCAECSRCFTRNYGLKKHMRLHWF